MKRRTILASTSVFACAVMTFLLTALGPQVHAQKGCVSLRALGQGVSPTNHPIHPATDNWGGDVWGALDSELLTGYFSGSDGDYASPGKDGTAHSTTSGHYVFVFGDDTFTFEVVQATFNLPPGKVAFGQYKGHGKIVAGTGRFQHASGSMDWESPFVAWSPDGTNHYSRANITITATICGLK